MAFNEIELARVNRHVGGLCRLRNRPDLEDQLKLEYEVQGHAVVLQERRPAFRGSGFMHSAVAKFRFVRTANEWRLYWMRADLKWHGYEPLPSSRELEALVHEVDSDPYCCFFG